LRLLGIDISIDDFGTGFSSLGQFFALPATELKIDRSLIQGEITNSGSLVSVIVGLAHERGLRVVAEGVETEYHLELARDLGCDRAQGYLIARPMPRAQLKEFLAA
jgi:EAL domain-containing protein (putative c-di-GMP-specific phosphodiesterase class I)